MISKQRNVLLALVVLTLCLIATLIYSQQTSPLLDLSGPFEPLSVEKICARHRSFRYREEIKRRYTLAMEHPETSRIANIHLEKTDQLNSDLADEFLADDDARILDAYHIPFIRSPEGTRGQTVSVWSRRYHDEIIHFCDGDEVSISARESIIEQLYLNQQKCEKSFVCESVNYCDHFTSRINMAGCRAVTRNKERRVLEANLLKTQPQRCQSPPESHLKPWIYKYRVFDDDQIFIYNDQRRIHLKVTGFGKHIREMEKKPQHLAYLDQYKHKALFPVHDPIIEYHGSGRYAYLNKNVCAIDGELGQEYIFPVTTPKGDFVVFWRIDGAKVGDSLIIYNLRNGVGTALGDNPYVWDHLPKVPQGQEHYSYQVPLELGGNNSEVHVWESQSPFGFRIRQYDGQKRAFKVYHPIKRTFTPCLSPKETPSEQPQK